MDEEASGTASAYQCWNFTSGFWLIQTQWDIGIEWATEDGKEFFGDHNGVDPWRRIKKPPDAITAPGVNKSTDGKSHADAADIVPRSEILTDQFP